MTFEEAYAAKMHGLGLKGKLPPGAMTAKEKMVVSRGGSPVRDSIEAIMEFDKPYRMGEIQKLTGRTYMSVKEAIATLIREGSVVRCGHMPSPCGNGRRTLYKRVSAASDKHGEAA